MCPSATYCKPKKLLTQTIKRTHDFLWDSDIDTTSALNRWLVFTLRTVYALGRDLGEIRLTFLTMSLHSL